MTDEIQQVVNEARDEFDLGAHLTKKPARTKSIRIFTDEEIGEELGGAEFYETRNDLGLVQKRVRTWGVAGQIVELKRTPEEEIANAEEIDRLTERVRELSEELDASAIDFVLRAVPPKIKRDAGRRAKAELGIHDKMTENHPRFDEYLAEEDSQLLSIVVQSWTLRDQERTIEGMTPQQARDARGFLPETEYQRLQVAVSELNWRRTIAERAVEDADF